MDFLFIYGCNNREQRGGTVSKIDLRGARGREMIVGGCGKHGTVCAGLLCTYRVVITPYFHAVIRTAKRRMCLVGVDPEDARYCKPKRRTTINT